MRLEGDELRDFFEKHAERIAPDGIWRPKYFYIGKYIPENKLKNALLNYADLSDGEIPLFLYDSILFSNAKEGMLLTTTNLHYNYSHNPGKIPLSDIQNAFFKSGKFNINGSSVKGSIFYIDSRPFVYFPNEPRFDNDLLNDIFGNLSVNGHKSSEPLQKPDWALEREELLYEIYSNDISMFGYGIIVGKYNIYITNARIVRIFAGADNVSGNYSQEKFFNTVELSDVRGMNIPKLPFKLDLELQNGGKVTFTGMHNEIMALNLYIGTAMERMIPAVTFEDPDEKFLFKEERIFSRAAFCSKEFWEEIFGGVSMNARFCVTNKRLLLYHIDQVSRISSDGKVFKYSITAPVLKCIWLPLSGIASVAGIKKGLSLSASLHIKNCTPAGFVSRSPVIPGIDNKGSEIMYDPYYIDNTSGGAAVGLLKLSCLTKKECQKVTGILRSILPY